MDQNKTVVVFRKHKDGEILALFPYEIEGRQGECMSYIRIGQHGLADYNHCIQITKPASDVEFNSLKLELERIGYNLDVRKRKA